MDFPVLQSKMPAVYAAPVESDTFIKYSTAAIATPIQRASEAVVGFETPIQAKAKESKTAKSERAHNTNCGIPNRERKRSCEDTGEQQAKRQAVPRSTRLSPNRGIHASGIRKGTRASANPAVKAQRQGRKKPFAQVHFISDLPPVREPSNEVIVISSDEDSDSDSDSDKDPYDARLVWKNYSQGPVGGILPTDSHQDDIVVNSTELKQDGVAVGITHYIESLNKQESYETISTTFDRYRTNGRNPKDLPNLDCHRDKCPAIRQDSSIDYTKLPKRNPADQVSQVIRHGSTKNNLVCLAIIRVAQINLPFINFDSALNNLANLLPTDPFPKLPQLSIFVDDIGEQPRSGDSTIKIVFIPDYYQDGRHVLGFYVDNAPHPDSCLFTPCTEMDLQRLGLIKVEGQDRGCWMETVVGTHHGYWWDKAYVPVPWNSMFHYVSGGWEARLRLIMGAQEAP